MTRSLARPAWLLSLLLLGCIRAPDVIVLDRRTALEEQAAGSYRLLEEELYRSQLVPHPVPLVTEQLPPSDAPTEPGRDGDQLDRLLVRRCVGEALDGSLVDTRARCSGKVDVPLLLRLIEDGNRQRQQIWARLQSAAKGKSLAEVRAAWRAVHLDNVVCGAQLEVAAGKWEAKSCD